MKKYNKEFKINFRDTDKEGNLKINALVDFMQEIAREHATILGVNFEDENSKYYWIILRTKINIITIPKIDETIRIETYPSGVDKLFAVREFNIYNEKDEKLGDIKGYYLLMEHNKTMPVKIKGNIEFPIFNNIYTGEKVEKLLPTNLEIRNTTMRKVYSSDIDVNGHMNNAHYVRWCLDMYDTNELYAKQIKSFQIQYVKQVMESEEVDMYRYKNGYVIGKNGEEISFIAKIDFY